MPDRPSGSGPHRWHGSGLTHIGRVRHSNQDAFAIQNECAVWVVADGMGGRPGGDVASSMAVRAVTDTVCHANPSLPTEVQTTAARLIQAIERANDTVYLESRRRPDLVGMGTTLVAFAVTAPPGSQLIAAHVGDSRAYRLRKGQLSRITQDHSWVEDTVRLGLLSPAEAALHPMRHVLTRAVGTEPSVEPEVTTQEVEDDDIYLLCTDGLTKMLADQHIATVLERPGLSPRELCERLIEEANGRGGEDNITVIVIRRSAAVDNALTGD